jgi:quinol monooxygenase YgiN
VFGLVVRFDVVPGKEEAFDRLTSQTLAHIQQREPGTLIYACHDVSTAANSRIFYELYRDEAAFEDHERQDHIQHFLAEREQYLSAPPRVEFLSLKAAKGVPVSEGT